MHEEDIVNGTLIITLSLRLQIQCMLIAFADTGMRGIQRSGIKEEAEGRGTVAELNAAHSGVRQKSSIEHSRPEVLFGNDCKQL